MSALALLLLADGRFPAGGHAHSAGVEAAIADARIVDIDSLEAFVRGRLATTGLVEAALAAATTFHVLRTDDVVEGLQRLDEEAGARIPCAPLRDASRRLGRSLARAASRCWPDTRWLALDDAAPLGAHQPVVLGVAAAVAGLGPSDAATVAVHHAVNTPALAAVRLLGLDPVEVAALIATIAHDAGAAVIAEAVAAADGEIAALPAANGLLLDIAALEHSQRTRRMFAT